MQVQDIMTSKIESVSPTLSLRDAAQKMRDLDIGSLAVWENYQLIGIVTDRDICCRAVSKGLDMTLTTVSDIMSREISYCFSDQDIADAAHLMEDKHIRRLAVLTRDNNMAGFISVDDLAHVSHDLAGEVLEAASPAH